MKVANTRKVNERIVQYMSREQLNSLLGMGLSAPVSVDEIIFEEPDRLLSYAESFRKQMDSNVVHYSEDQSVILCVGNKKEFYGNIYFVSKGKKKMICQDLERAYRGRS